MAGLTWANIGAGLPEAPVRALAVHPRKAAFVYLGAEVGVFASEDARRELVADERGPDELFRGRSVLDGGDARVRHARARDVQDRFVGRLTVARSGARRAANRLPSAAKNLSHAR